MFDYHLHSGVSFDTDTPAKEMVQAAAKAGLTEICFTDHYDHNSDPALPANLFTPAAYSAAYDTLAVPAGLTVRRGVEFGLTVWNQRELTALLGTREFDFVIGSVHFVDGLDPYDPEYWQGKTVKQAFARYLEGILACVKVHHDFDVLGHLTYVCKSAHNPTREPVRYSDFSDITDEILRVLVAKGIGLEVNTSGMDAVGECLPSADFLRRFRELGGEIVTVGTDAHDGGRVGQYIPEALALVRDVFGYVCTFEKRRPVFHKLDVRR